MLIFAVDFLVSKTRSSILLLYEMFIGNGHMTFCNTSNECQDTLQCKDTNCECKETDYWNGTRCILSMYLLESHSKFFNISKFLYIFAQLFTSRKYKCARVVCSYLFLGTGMSVGKLQFALFQHCNL